MNVTITERAARYVNKLDKSVQQQLKGALSRLYDFPDVTNIKQLKGRPRRYRMRVGDWRIIFTVDWEKDTLIVVTIAHRKDAYK